MPHGSVTDEKNRETVKTELKNGVIGWGRLVGRGEEGVVPVTGPENITPRI